MLIATWNVNSIRARLENVLDWVRGTGPDVLLLQEIKAEEATFPRLEFEALGYRALVCGQKAYNGVAILSRLPAEETTRGLPGDAGDGQARYLEARIDGRVRVATLYVPNGNPVQAGVTGGGDKFSYKLRWLERLFAHGRSLLATGDPVILAGDYNVCPTDDDVYDPAGWAGDALCRPESRHWFRALQWLGYTDALRALHPGPGEYTFWDYQAGAWPRDLGLRIDHFLLSPAAADRLTLCRVDRGPRAREKASDHTPVLCDVNL